jgi:hypothetical protein
MPTTETRDNPTSAAVAEASRLFSESSRRSVEQGKAAVEAARDLLDDAAEVNTKLFEVWLATAEGALKASFEVYNSGMAASFPLLDAATATSRTVLQQWDAAARQGQTAVLDAFHAQARAAGRVTRR